MTAPKKDPSAMGLPVGPLWLPKVELDCFSDGRFRVWKDHLGEWNWDAGEFSSQSPALYTAGDAAENLRSALASIGYFGLLNRPSNVDKQRRRLLAEKCERLADSALEQSMELRLSSGFMAVEAYRKRTVARSAKKHERATKLRALAERLRGETR